MENYFYKCPICGYVHLVPAYWVSFSPENQFEQPHMNPNTGEVCKEVKLDLVEEQPS